MRAGGATLAPRRSAVPWSWSAGAIIGLIYRYGFRPGVWPWVLLGIGGFAAVLSLAKGLRVAVRYAVNRPRSYGRHGDRHRPPVGMRRPALMLAAAAVGVVMVNVLASNPPH
jgi:hypothetical protein